MVSVAVAGRSEDESLGAEVVQRPQFARRSAAPAGFDGESAMLLVEVSRALHRASIALDGMGPGTLARSWTGRGQDPDVSGDTPEGVEPDTVQGNISKAIVLVDGLNAARTDRPGEASAALPPVEKPDALRQVLERIAGDLNASVIRSSFEASLILEGALHFTSDPEVAQRISTVIELLDENIRDVRSMIFGFDYLWGVTDAVSRR